MNAGGGFLTRWVLIPATVLSIVTMWVPARGGFRYAGGWRSATVYDAQTWWPILVVAAASGVAVAHRYRWFRRWVAGAGMIAGCRLAGTGLVAFRRWYTAGGFTAAPTNIDTVRALAIGLTAAGLLASAVCLGQLRAASREFARSPIEARVAVAACAAFVGVGVPIFMGVRQGGGTLTTIGAHAAMYGLPWAAAVALVARLHRRQAAVLMVFTVIDMAWVQVDRAPMVAAPHHEVGVLLAMVILVSVTAFASAFRGGYSRTPPTTIAQAG